MTPRIVIAGLGGESGKTLVSLGLALAVSRTGVAVRTFKKGPDYIDAAWLSWASGSAARNLDTYLMGTEVVLRSFTEHATPDGLNLIEGNRGLYDGVDSKGTHSTAVLAKALRAPVVLVVNVTKVTRTVAAFVLGCQKLDPEVQIAGVVLNRVGNPRHEQIVREAVEGECGLPVLGAIPRQDPALLLPERHLGLVTPAEHGETTELADRLAELARTKLDIDRIMSIARQARPLDAVCASCPKPATANGLRIGYLKDSAFTFYYPENLEAIESSGAELVAIDAMHAATLPANLHALYIGGGFPETHAEQLSANREFLFSLKEAARMGLPVYAECGGLMLLSRAIRWRGGSYPMAGVLPFETEVLASPQGHGYAQLVADRPNPFFPKGTKLQGHEFHYSKILLNAAPPPTACAVERGAGCYARRDGVLIGNVMASYVHLHAAATPEWVKGLLTAAHRYRLSRGRGRLLLAG